MKLYISADMEGTAAVVSWTQDPKNTTECPYYHELMSLEVRAAIDGASEAGARMIYNNREPFSMTEGINATCDAANAPV